MKRLVLVLAIGLFLTGCGVFERGNYDKDRSGYVMSGDLLVSYHTNSVGEIDLFMIDQIMSYFEALEYVSFDMNQLDTNALIPSIVSESELDSCGISHEAIPRFIRIDEQTYYFNVRDNGYCTFDEYTFHRDGFSDEAVFETQDVSPLEDENVTLFKDADFKVNTFETIIFIETIEYNAATSTWEKNIISALPMSVRQAGNLVEDNSVFMEELSVLERYVLKNQSVNLLALREDFESEDVNNIWADETIDVLGRDHEVIRTVRTKKAGDLLDIINDSLSRLGMFS
jgi:hypothetical protein